MTSLKYQITGESVLEANDLRGAATDHVPLEDGRGTIGRGLGFAHYGLEGGGGRQDAIACLEASCFVW
jgi:hypothetical protein